MWTTFYKMLLESHLRYYALITSKNCTIFKYEHDFGSKIELCHCELHVTSRKKDFRVLDYQPKAKRIAVLSYSL